MKTAEELFTFGQANAEAFVKSSQIVATGLQELSKQFAATAQATMDETMDLQASLARFAMDKAVSQTGQAAEASFRLAEQAMAPIAGRVTLAVDTLKVA